MKHKYVSRYPRTYKRDKNNKQEEKDRQEATKELLKEIWFLPLFPFTLPLGLLFGFNGIIVGLSIGLFFMCILALEMRYGKAL